MNAQQKRINRLTHAPFLRARLYNYERTQRQRARLSAIVDTIALALWSIAVIVLTLIALQRIN